MCRAVWTVILSFVTTFALAADRAKPWEEPATVVVNVGGNDQLVDDQLTSFLARELRALPDVRVVFDAPEYGPVLFVQVSTVPICNGDNVATAYVFSQRYYLKDLDGSAVTCTKLVYSGVTGSSRNDMKNVALAIATAFDAHGLTDLRNAKEAMRRAAEAAEQKQPPR